MAYKITSLVATLSLLAPQIFAEAFTLHQFEGRSHDIIWGERGDEDQTTFLGFYKIGRKVVEINDDKLQSLDKLHEAATRYDSSMDPFYGPGVSFLAKDSKGTVYSISLEYVEGHKTFNGMRCSITRLQPIGNVAGVYINPASLEHPSGGSCFDKPLLAHLIRAVKQQAQQAGTGQPATRPESKSEGGDKPQPEAEGRSR